MKNYLRALSRLNALPFHTLRGRLTLLACLATLPAFLFVVYVAAKERTTALQSTEIQSLYVADLASREHAYQVSGAAQLLERMDMLLNSKGELDHDAQRLLPMILKGFPQFANLGVLDLEGNVLFSVVPPPHHVKMQEIKSFQQALASDRVAVGTYLVGRIVERPILFIAKALRDANATPRVLLFAALDLAWLNQLSSQAVLPQESAMLIVDNEGNILASSLASLLSPFDHAHRTETLPQALDCFPTLKTSPTHLTRCKMRDGVYRLSVATPLQGVRDIWVVIGTPEQAVYASANRIFFRDLTVLALFAVFAIVASLIATDISVLRDLRLLAAATQRFGKGDLQARAPVPTPSGEIRDLTNTFNTMADTLALRHHQAEQAQEHLRALSHRLQNAREKEAARIAQELHDGLGQELSVLRLELERLRRRILKQGQNASPEALAEAIDEIGDRVDTTVRSVRQISSDLRPGVLDRLGLVAALEWLLSEFERRTGIHTRLTLEGTEPQANPETSTALFRILQETLANVARHSDATHVSATLHSSATELTLIVRDNGRGFDVNAERATPSLGLLGMKERALRLGGTVTIASEARKGTKTNVTLPQSSHPPT
ncbi:Putative sensory box histidine kinase [gamma proteobacterium HdN1]|nr:Putative sensory box histidine kinase [gamma proteobacterium HdN1]